MLGPSHATLGAAAGVVLGHLAGADAHMANVLPSQLPVSVTGGLGLAGMALACGAVGAISALLPDCDTEASTLGKLLPRWWHALTPGHRGCTHSLLAVAVWWAATALACAGLGIAGPGARLLPVLVAVGVASHLLADALTDHGIMPLWPLRWHLRSPLAFRTGSWPESVAVGAAVLGTAAWLAGPVVGAVVRGGVA